MRQNEAVKKMQKILIVDANIITYDFIVNQLRPKQHMVFSALDGAAALEFIEHHTLNCVIVDLNIEYINGLEIINLVQKWYAQRPWIIATCQKNNPNSGYPWLDLATSIGADEILAKPYCMEQLWDLLPTSITKAQNHYENIPAHSEQVHRSVFQTDLSV